MARMFWQMLHTTFLDESPWMCMCRRGLKWILGDHNLDEKEGVHCPGHSKWTICIPSSPFYSGNFLSFSLSYWEAYSYYPRGPITGKDGQRGFFQPKNWMRQRAFSAWGVQTGPFAAHWAHFVPDDFKLFHLHTGRPILITPEG